MRVTLRPEIERFLEGKVRAGQYASLEEAANELIATAREQEKLSDEEIEQLRREVAVGIAQADAGEFSEYTAEQIIQQEAERRKHKAG